MTNFALDQQWLRLTHREKEVLLWVGDGMSNQEIAQQLGLSVGTVKVHIHTTFSAKLALHVVPTLLCKWQREAALRNCSRQASHRTIAETFNSGLAVFELLRWR